MKRVHIIQCLCPARHCIVALAWESRDGSPGEVARMVARFEHDVRALVRNGHVNPWCGICSSREFRFEDLVTEYPSIEAAWPAIEANAAAQARTRAILGQPGKN